MSTKSPDRGGPGGGPESPQAQPASNAPAPHDPTPDDPEDRNFYAEPVWKRFYVFLLGPALIAVSILAVFTIYSVLTTKAEDPIELVTALKSGGEHRRWQAAFALTKYLQPSATQGVDAVTLESDADYQAKLQRVKILVPDLLDVWNDPDRGDGEVRRFLALAFSYLGDTRVVPVVAKELTSDDTELVHYALAAIAKTHETAPPSAETLPDTLTLVLAASNREESDIRATAVYVLAVLGGQRAMLRLKEALTDHAPAVAWNAAFGLARHKDTSGEKVILEILDRGPIYQAVGLDPARQRDLFLNAVRSAGMVPTPALQERLARIAKSDENLVARDMAIKLLESPGLTAPKDSGQEEG